MPPSPFDLSGNKIMAPDRVSLPFLDSVNSLWGLISGVFIGLWVSFKIIWNISRYFRGVDDRFAKLENETEALRETVSDLKHCAYRPGQSIR